VESLDRTHLIDVTRFLNAEFNRFPHWSPDGQHIVFSSAHRVMQPPGLNVEYLVENDEIMVVATDGSNPVNLSQHPAIDIMPKWSPDGEWIAFFSNRDGFYDLYLMRSDGSGTRKVAPLRLERNDPQLFTLLDWDAYGVNYTWLPDGKSILFQDQLIDLESGEILRIPFPFDKGSTAWFVPPADVSLLPIPTSHCAAGWSQLYQGIYAVVAGETDDPPNRVRNSPTTDTEVVAQLYPATIIKVTGGPVCADGLVFWQVEHESIPGGVGWTAEGEGIGASYFLVHSKPWLS
jgi:dipeptidyl aminopeptidase/acylaminoacyl peptidase